MDHLKEANRLLDKSVDGLTSGSLSDADDAATRLSWATQAQVHATLAVAEAIREVLSK